MNNKELAKALMEADSSASVVEILNKSGYWQDDTVWRHLGDNETNFASIGGQQSDPVASLVEKIINGVDARLMNACLEQSISPESSEAPSTMREGVARFFEGGSDAKYDGKIRYWSEKLVRREAHLLTVAATGKKPSQGDPCITIADQGEGQIPDNFPYTFLSLQKGNKNKIQFVQGKYNMGGTGALNFCKGPHRLQLIISRRNPALLSGNTSERDNQWGFTVVRRERPRGNEKNSTFTYLAPFRSSNRDGQVLSFTSEYWPIFPNGNRAYSTISQFGSLVKLYEYDLQNKGNIVSSGSGLFRRLDQGMPELMLPVRVFECRGYKDATLEGTLTGLIARLDKDRSHTLEPGFPEHAMINWEGQVLPLHIYAFAKGQGRHYRMSNAGVLLTLNGQTHATMLANFYRRKAVDMSYLADSLLTIIDCSNLRRDKQEELFMTSRDRLRKSTFATGLEQKLEEQIFSNSTLRELRNRRRKEQIGEQLSEDKPLADILNTLVKKDPILAKLFEIGSKITTPFAPGNLPNGKSDFFGKQFPTFFQFKKKSYGNILKRKAKQGHKIRLEFVTDAVNDYFSRDVSPGNIDILVNDQPPIYSLSPLREGSCNVSLNISDEYVEGDIIEVKIEVTDESRIEPFTNIANIELISSTVSPPGPPTPPNAFTGSLSLPNIKRIRQAEWVDYGFDAESALTVISQHDDDTSHLQYDFYVNVDNVHLKNEQKESNLDARIIEARFIYTMVLFSLAILRNPSDFKLNSVNQSEGKGIDIEEIIKSVSKSLARIVLRVFDLAGELIDFSYFDE